MQTTKVEVGQVIEQLTVREIFYKHNGHQNVAYARCDCSCGGKSEPRVTALFKGKIQSCGCIKRTKARERTIKRNTTHGLSRHPLMRVWLGMKQRCYLTTSISYCNYGAKGIRICDDWLSDFKKFYDWAINNGYQEGLTIEREDSNKDYCPENCKWATWIEQNNNKKSNHCIEAFGETKTLTNWARDSRVKVSSRQIAKRLTLGWSTENAISTPTLRIRCYGQPK